MQTHVNRFVPLGATLVTHRNHVPPPTAVPINADANYIRGDFWTERKEKDPIGKNLQMFLHRLLS